MILAARQLTTDITPVQRQEILSRMEEDTAIRWREALNPMKGFTIAAGRDLLRRIGALALRKTPNAVKVQHEARGKPYLEVLTPSGFVRSSYHVSISHSGCGLLAVLSDRNTACDIQEMRHFPLVAVCGFFSSEDQRMITSAEEPDNMLIKLWCRRECLIKLFGAGFPVRTIQLGNTKELLKRCGIILYETQWKHMYLAVTQVKEANSDCACSEPNIEWVNI